MNFYSTNQKSRAVSMAEAVVLGQADDGGLYLPESTPRLPREFLSKLQSKSFCEIAYEVSRAFAGDEIPREKLRAIIEEAFDFPVPLVRLSERFSILELFHGPTLSFKDFGARFMARLMGYFVAREAGGGRGEELFVVAATSGDTGGAVAQGFFGIPGIRVVVLYPSGQVSEIQEKQLATLGGNVMAVEVVGNFDDCQRLVKQALADAALRERRRLTTANSINIARLIPQVFYYFHGYARLAADPRTAHPREVVFGVPSGNFGNLTAGVLARRMGLPVRKLIASTNINNVVPRYLKSGAFEPRESVRTISSAMDVGNPSNFARLLELCGSSPEESLKGMRDEIWGSWHSDEETEQAIARCWREHGYLLDPHAAVGELGLEAFGRKHREPIEGIALATAHPAKFTSIVERAAGIRIELPPQIREMLAKEKKASVLRNDYEAFRSLLAA